MERTLKSGIGRVAVAAVSFNLVIAVLLAVVLPQESQVLLPLVALILPLLTAAGLERYAQSPRTPQRPAAASFSGQTAPTTLSQAHA
ncbi:MAG: hypothetical protein ABW321_27725 [Polyangiales bacterium]